MKNTNHQKRITEIRIQCKKPRLSGSQDEGYYTEFCIRAKGHRGECNYQECF